MREIMTENLATPRVLTFRDGPAHRWEDFRATGTLPVTNSFGGALGLVAAGSASTPQVKMAEVTPYSQYLSRRDFLKAAGIVTGGTLLAACAPNANGFPQVEAYSRVFPESETGLERVWGSEEFENAWKQAVTEALEGDGGGTITLPEGETFIDRKLTLEVPDGVRIYVNGNKNKTRIKGSSELSRHPNVYGAKGNNLMEIGVGEDGYVSFDKVNFDGGSQVAGVGGYEAPPSPWNSILAVYGRGAGDRLDNTGAQPKGRAEILNCNFEKSQGPGLMVQNLEDFRVAGCTSRATDCLITANWCDKGEITKCYGRNLLSDFVFSVWSRNIVVSECGIDLAWTGYNFRSCTDIEVNDCYAGYCLAAVSTSEVINGSNERTVGLTVSKLQSWGSSCVYAFQHADQVVLFDGVHDNLGDVLNAESYMVRINNPEWVAEEPIYLGPNIGLIAANNELFRKSAKAPAYYSLRDQLPGCTFVDFD